MSHMMDAPSGGAVLQAGRESRIDPNDAAFDRHRPLRLARQQRRITCLVRQRLHRPVQRPGWLIQTLAQAQEQRAPKHQANLVQV